MTTDVVSVGRAAGRSRPAPLLLALTWQEARRMLRSPWLVLGVLVTGFLAWSFTRDTEWHGEQYLSGFYPSSGLHLATAILVALAFHRERAGLAPGTPVGEVSRGVSRLLAAVPLLGLTALSIAWLVAYVWSNGGLDLGDEPGRTLHAYPTAPEILQPMATGLLAVATGAAAGRRFRHRATAVLTLFLGWYAVTAAYWLYQASWLAPFSVFQSQPVYVDLGPDVDPNRLPAAWLLSVPGQYQAHWERLVVSPSLAWWHDLWLVALAVMVVALAFPSPVRRRLAIGGAGVAVIAIVAQFVVYPS
ncbi:hypothetical protein GCM10009798_24510 [Nocardioides panacihumi]|uniref:ABC transporter permease n=1 Tax=Nocardioides panacihumi TaxID=400774 RepID=A0ABN2R556_9ACTN